MQSRRTLLRLVVTVPPAAATSRFSPMPPSFSDASSAAGDIETYENVEVDDAAALKELPKFLRHLQLAQEAVSMILTPCSAGMCMDTSAAGSVLVNHFKLHVVSAHGQQALIQPNLHSEQDNLVEDLDGAV